MEHCFLDTNILLDLLVKERSQAYPETLVLFEKAQKRELKLSCSSLSLVNVHYVLKKELKEDQIRSILVRIQQLTSVAALNESTLELALASSIKDFEDAIQNASALQSSADLILTRNLKDFRKSELPCLTVKAYLNTFEN